MEAAAAEGFKSISSHGIVEGCVVWMEYSLKFKHLHQKKRGMSKCSFQDIAAKCMGGINVQAACDHQCQFISVCISAPSGTNDLGIKLSKTTPTFVRKIN